jgi:hypothetical protein
MSLRVLMMPGILPGHGRRGEDCQILLLRSWGPRRSAIAVVESPSSCQALILLLPTEVALSLGSILTRHLVKTFCTYKRCDLATICGGNGVLTHAKQLFLVPKKYKWWHAFNILLSNSCMQTEILKLNLHVAVGNYFDNFKKVVKSLLTCFTVQISGRQGA